MPGPVFGNRIVDLELIVEAFAQLYCSKCFADKIELFEDSRYGLWSHLTLKCKGFARAFKLCSTLNLPRLTKTVYKETKLLKVVQDVAEESMIKAATEIVEKKQNLSSDIVKCGISVDGTWQRRGYTSMNGCVAAISVDTGRIFGKLEESRSVTSVAAEFGIAHSIVSRLWRQFQTTGTAIRGFSSGRPRGTTPADDQYIVLQARRNRWQTAGEIARHTTQATG
ncbi:transposable element Tcb1 transposase [Trichonephila clavipes]|nr:transposable element Tcb1 transposase [Trichonephila clavipes]